MNPLKFRKATLGLREVLKQERPDLIHPVNTMPCIAGPQASAGLGIPCVRTITGLGALFSSDSLRYRLTQAAFCQMHKRVARHCLHTIFQNPEDRDYFVEKRLVAPEQTGPESTLTHWWHNRVRRSELKSCGMNSGCVARLSSRWFRV